MSGSASSGDIEMRRQPWGRISSSASESGRRPRQRSLCQRVSDFACSRICCLVGVTVTAVVAVEAFYLVNRIVNTVDGGVSAITELSERIEGLEKAIRLIASVAQDGIHAVGNITIPEIPLEELERLLNMTMIVLNPSMPVVDGGIDFPDPPDLPDPPG